VSPHAVETTKFTVEDAEISKAFYEDMLGMRELRRFVAEGNLVEPFMGWSEDSRIGLLDFVKKETVKKSPHPVTVVTLPNLDEVAARFESAGLPFNLYEGAATGGVRLAIVSDPSGNVIELVEVEGPPAVAGARLIVDDRAAAEEWFLQIFGMEPGRRIVNDNFDEVFFDVGEGMFLALYEPMGEGPQPKSENPVVAIYTTEFDLIRDRVKAGGLPVIEYGTHMLLANDPSGNVVEVVRRRVP
jgi:catechol 2,3-dioxygenase-like lactoylglutathione lyase family enzyme